MNSFLIYSYPRSGNTLTRLIIEECFNYRTYGYTSRIDIAPLKFLENGYLNYIPNVIGYKRHWSLTEAEKQMPMIYLERDIEDAIKSHKDKGSKCSAHAEKNHWISARVNYETHQKKKICIPYQMLINNTGHALSLMEHFFEKQSFEVNIESLKQRAREIYKLEHNGKG